MAIRDYVFALALVEPNDLGMEMIDFLGTAFLIGNKGFALTAGHVLPKNSLHKLAGMFVIQDKWHCFLVKQQEECVDADGVMLESSVLKF